MGSIGLGDTLKTQEVSPNLTYLGSRIWVTNDTPTNLGYPGGGGYPPDAPASESDTGGPEM